MLARDSPRSNASGGPALKNVPSVRIVIKVGAQWKFARTVAELNRSDLFEAVSRDDGLPAVPVPYCHKVIGFYHVTLM